MLVRPLCDLVSPSEKRGRDRAGREQAHRGRVRSSDSAVSRSTGDTSDGFRRTRLVYHHLDGILIAQCSKPADYKNSGRGRSDWLPLVTLT